MPSPVCGRSVFTCAADSISGVPADLFGLEQRIEVGPMSGRSNVQWYLEKRGKQPTDEAVARVLELAKTTPRLLTEDEILQAAGV